MAIYEEKQPAIPWLVLLLTAVFLLSFPLMQIGLNELSFSGFTSLTSTSLVSLPSSGDTLINSQVLCQLLRITQEKA